MRRASLFRSAVVGCLMLAACGTPRQDATIQGIHDDQFSPAVEVDGAAMFANPLGGPTLQWSLTSFVDKKSRDVLYRLDLDFIGTPPAPHFYLATDDTAQQLRLVRLSRSRYCALHECNSYETVGIVLDKDVLAARLNRGYAVKVSGRDGSSAVLTVTPDMIAKQMAAVNQVLASLRAAPASTQ